MFVAPHGQRPASKPQTNLKSVLAIAQDLQRTLVSNYKIVQGDYMNKALEAIYLDYVNNYLTIKGFASGYHISDEDAENLISVLKHIADNNDDK